MAPLTQKQQHFGGIRVIELTGVAAAPAAGQLLACLGAEVIKAENSNAPDIARAKKFFLFGLPALSRFLLAFYPSPRFRLSDCR
jgi:crotonobetainyl-CoA:carnitine CoA-transferase CaiB-like acyl-CoA transferase